MYKTTYELMARVIGAGNGVIFADTDPTPGAATAALNQIKSCRDIDTVVVNDDSTPAPGETVNVIIPYHAIDYILVLPTRSETEDPVDDTLKNCTEGEDDDGGEGGETGTLKIIAGVDIERDTASVGVNAAIEGQYGPLTFEVLPDDEVALAYAVLPDMSAGDSIEVPGLPLGITVYYVNEEGENGETTVPATITVGTSK